MSRVTILFFSMLQITRSAIWPYVKWTVSMIADGHLIFLRGLCEYVWVNTQAVLFGRWKVGGVGIRG